MPDEWDMPAEGFSWDVTIPTDDASIVRRRRALAPIQLLTDIERTKSSLHGNFWNRYDLFNIALAVIDQVALAMGISAGRTWDETVEYATAQAARQVPEADREQWLAVGERVVVSLVTTDVETVPYLVHTVQGPQWRSQRFRLLYVHAHAGGGSEYLRASEQAINIFIDALDLDIEAAQIANEAQLAALIARGAVESAVQIARHARYRSVQYQERIRRILADTMIDPDTHDWLTEVPAVLDNALVHVKERLQAEADLLDAVATRRQELSEPSGLVAANALVEILRECRHRHDELHGHLIGARTRLREALDDRFARAPRASRRADLAGDLLAPCLARTTTEGSMIVGHVLCLLGSMQIRWWPSLTVITDELCAPSRVPDEGDDLDPPEFADEDSPEWWEPYEQATDALIEGIDEPTRLSHLLARLDDVATRLCDNDGDPLAADVLAASIVHAAHRAWAPSLAGRSAGERLVIAVDVARTLSTETVRSADLLLIPALVTADIDDPSRQAALPEWPADADENEEAAV